MVATRTANLSRCVLRCRGSRWANSALIPSAQIAIPLTCVTARSHAGNHTGSVHHTQLQPVNPPSQKTDGWCGRGLYLLRHDLRSAKAALTQAPADAVVDFAMAILASSELEPDELADFAAAVAKAAGVGVRAVMARIVKERRQRERAQRKAAMSKANDR